MGGYGGFAPYVRVADHVELIAKAGTTSLTKAVSDQSDQILADSDLSSLFGIDMGEASQKDLKSSNQNIKIKKKLNKIAKVKTTRQLKAKVAKVAKKTPKKKRWRG